MPVHHRAASRSAAALVLGFIVWFAPGAGAALADDTTVAWSVSPAHEDGTLDGRTRLELQVDAGATVADHVTIANASTAEQTFDVYGADAINTADGGYDLLAAATPSTDAGTWITVDQPQVTIPALSTATVAVTVAVPATATPGDHAAGILVSRTNPTPDAGGVVVDSRVAVRVYVRVSGELQPALTVSDVRVHYTPSLVPFAPSNADVSYTVRNTGNVMVLGTPRVRVTGPFGTQLATRDAEQTNEVLPGQSFTVHTVLAGVEPAVVGTAVVDVAMAAAPGPETEIPLVSSTARKAFPAVPWTGLAVLVLVGLGVWWWLRARRIRRQEGEAMWAELVDHAKAGELPPGPAHADGRRGTPGGAASALGIALVLVLGTLVSALVATSPASAADGAPSGQAQVNLSIPPAPSPSSSASSSATPSAPPTSSRPNPRPSRGGSPVLPDTGSTETPTPTPLATYRATPAPSRTPAPAGADTVWRPPRGLTPPQWALLSVSGAVAASAAGFGVRTLVRARGRAVAS